MVIYKKRKASPLVFCLCTKRQSTKQTAPISVIAPSTFPYRGEYPARNSSRNRLANHVWGSIFAIMRRKGGIEDKGQVKPERIKPAKGYVTENWTKRNSVGNRDAKQSPSDAVQTVKTPPASSVAGTPAFNCNLKTRTSRIMITT